MILSRPKIDWNLISQAIAFYKARGYTYVEVPWIVSEEALRVTLPAGKEGLRTAQGALVGSAEQGFIQMMMDGQLPLGRYVTASPCFRDDTIDALHQQDFFKVELIDRFSIVRYSVDDARTRLIGDASDFFFNFESIPRLKLPKTEAGFDIELNGIEIGSYGFRQYKGFFWIYGTGLAEPRFSIARKSLT